MYIFDYEMIMKDADFVKCTIIMEIESFWLMTMGFKENKHEIILSGEKKSVSIDFFNVKKYETLHKINIRCNWCMFWNSNILPRMPKQKNSKHFWPFITNDLCSLFKEGLRKFCQLQTTTTLLRFITFFVEKMSLRVLGLEWC